MTSSIMAMDKLAIVTNEDNPDEIYTLYIESSDNGSLVNLYVYCDKNKPDDGCRPDKPSIYTFTQVQKGLSLVTRGKREIVNLKGVELDQLAGGVAHVDFLHSGITGSRIVKKLQILSEDGKWVMKTMDNRLIKNIHFTVKKVFGKTIGLDKMIINKK
jgi:hypothetical protein